MNKCNCKECTSIREKAEYILKEVKEIANTSDIKAQKLLRNIADEIYRSQGFKTRDDIIKDYINKEGGKNTKGTRNMMKIVLIVIFTVIMILCATRV